MNDTRVIDEFNGEYRFLSNFYQFPFEFEGLTYPNAEAAFEAQKCATDEEKNKLHDCKESCGCKKNGQEGTGLSCKLG